MFPLEASSQTLILLKVIQQRKRDLERERMAIRPSCSSGDGRSSSPVPLIGLYIAGATLVCFLLMLCDIISSVRHKTRYIPCKWFSLNSATLTLLAIASKLPVDLTTNMPSAGDQLSKLTGTTMVCISICFLVPSLGINGETESITNMIALSLFVVTIAVNICIQIYTGVIFSFIVEHIMILCCMLTMLTVMWAFNFFISNHKTALVETIRNIFVDTKASSLLHQVKLWYLSSCISNPQYVLRGGDYGLSLVMICFVCLAVVSQAALRSLVHKLAICEGVSDYGWSISTILVIQIITIVVGSLATAFRWITIVSDPPLHMKNDIDFDLEMYFDIEKFSFQYLTKKRKVRKVSIIFVFYFLLKMVIVLTAFVTLCVLGAPVYVIRIIFRYCCSNFTRAVDISEKWKTQLRDVFSPTKKFPEWIMRIRVEDMNKWMDLSDKSPPNHLVQLLSKPRSHPPQTLLNKLQQIGTTKGYYRLSCLSLVILVKIAALSIPLALADPILKAMDEAFELIYYIDKKINVGNFEDQRKRQFAKVLLACKNIHLSKKDPTPLNTSVNEAISSIENEYQAFPTGFAEREMEIIRDFILDQDYESINELHGRLEQLFVDMLLFFLPQLPIVIFKDVFESPIEFHEERARLVLKLLCKLKLLEDKVQWLFPEGSYIRTLMDPEDQNLTPC